MKLKAVAYKGGKCVICGYDKYAGALQFHHLNPETKIFHIAQCRTSSLERIKDELDKCVLLCSRCHDEVEGGVTKLPD